MAGKDRREKENGDGGKGERGGRNVNEGGKRIMRRKRWREKKGKKRKEGKKARENGKTWRRS